MIKVKQGIIKFHYSYIIVAISFILTGYYSNLIVLTSLIIIHEVGHYIVAKFCSFNVLNIIIYPFGGVTKISEHINKNINSELLIAISGVIFQEIFYILITITHANGIIRDNIFNIYTEYNKAIIYFNLLPIYPLDGGKILNLLLSKIIYYRLSNILTIIISIIILIIITILNIYKKDYSYIISLSVIIYYLINYIKNLKYIYNKFLLERYLYKIKYSSKAIINNPNRMYKNKTHLIRINSHYIKEEKYLKKYFLK